MSDTPDSKSDSTEQIAVQGVNAGRDIKIGNITQIRDHVVKIIKKPVSIAVGVLMASVGTVGIIFANKHQSVIINGNVHDSNVANELTIYQGDPPEVRQKKLEQAKSLIVEEVFTNISNMDARLRVYQKVNDPIT